MSDENHVFSVQETLNENTNDSKTEFTQCFPEVVISWFLHASENLWPPKIDIGTRTGNIDYHDHFQPSELPASVVWFIDRFQCPGLAFRIKSKDEKDTNVFVYTLFQKPHEPTHFYACECHKTHDNNDQYYKLCIKHQCEPGSPWYLQCGLQNLEKLYMFKALIDGSHPFCMLV